MNRTNGSINILEDKFVVSGFLALNLLALSQLIGLEQQTRAQLAALFLLVASLPFLGLAAIIGFNRSNERKLPDSKANEIASLLSILATLGAFSIALARNTMFISATFAVCVIIASIIYVSVNMRYEEGERYRGESIMGSLFGFHATGVENDDPE